MAQLQTSNELVTIHGAKTYRGIVAMGDKILKALHWKLVEPWLRLSK